MKKWLKVGAVVVIVVVATIILAPRVYVRNPNAHLTIDGRVTDDFKVYFGPSGRMLIDVQQANSLFVYWPSVPHVISFCQKEDVIFRKSLAFTKHHPPKCYLMGGFMPGAQLTDNSLTFFDNGRRQYELSWQAPSR